MCPRLVAYVCPAELGLVPPPAPGTCDILAAPPPSPRGRAPRPSSRLVGCGRRPRREPTLSVGGWRELLRRDPSADDCAAAPTGPARARRARPSANKARVTAPESLAALAGAAGNQSRDLACTCPTYWKTDHHRLADDRSGPTCPCLLADGMPDGQKLVWMRRLGPAANDGGDGSVRGRQTDRW